VDNSDTFMNCKVGTNLLIHMDMLFLMLQDPRRGMKIQEKNGSEGKKGKRFGETRHTCWVFRLEVQTIGLSCKRSQMSDIHPATETVKRRFVRRGCNAIAHEKEEIEAKCGRFLDG
jgi:hypothetical protein